MPSLLDIAELYEVIHGVTVKGVSARGIAYLMARFPELQMLMAGRQFAIDPARIMALAPEAIAAIIAVGCGYVPDGSDDAVERQKQAEDKAANLSLEFQSDFIEPIIRLTLPGGVGPFVAKMEKLASIAGDAFTKVQDTNLAPPS